MWEFQERRQAKRDWRDWRFPSLLFIVTTAYLGLLLALVLANLLTVSLADISRLIRDPYILSSLRLTLVTCAATAILSVLVAVPIGYLLSRYRFRGHALVDALIDIPILLPPLVIGLSLLVLFNQVPLASLFLIMVGGLMAISLASFLAKEKAIALGLFVFGLACLGIWCGLRGSERPFEQIMSEWGLPVTFHPLGVVLAQFPVAASFAIRVMKTTFDQIDPRAEKLAQTLGCHAGEAFQRVVLPQAGRGMMAAGTMAWARALGEFGPILVFAGAIRGKTEVLSTSIFLEINLGNLSGAAALSLLMILLAVSTLLFVRFFIERKIADPC